MFRSDRNRIIRQNLCTHRSEVRKIRLAMIAASVLLILFFGTLLGLKRAFTEINETFLSNRYLWVGCASEDDVRETVSELIAQNGVEGLSIGGFAYLKPSACELGSADLLALETGDCFLKCGDATYQGQSSSDKTSSALPVWIQFSASHIAEQTKKNIDLLQYGAAQLTPSEMLSVGRMPSAEHEIVLSAQIMRAFGIADDTQTALIGKPISLGLMYNGDAYICLEAYYLTGIISDQYVSQQSLVFSHIRICYDGSNTELKYQSELGMDTGYQFSIQAYTDSFKRCHSLCKELEASGHKDVGYPLTIQTAIFLNDAITITEKLFSFVLIAFCMILLVSVVSGLFFYCASVRESYHMLYTLGSTGREIRRIAHIELLRILGCAYGWSVILTVGVLLFLPKLLDKLTYGIKIFSLSYVDVLLSLMAGAALCLICYLITTLSLKKYINR